MLNDIKVENIKSLRENYDFLREIPCPDCCLNYCAQKGDYCEEWYQWMKKVVPFIFSPLLEQVIEEFTQNHSSTSKGKSSIKTFDSWG